MRRSLLVTAAAAISMVLLAMLVPMAILVRSYALEDRLARAALEVQAVETVVSRYDDKGSVAVYVDRSTTGTGTPRSPCSTPTAGRRPDPGEDAMVLDARNTGRARVDDVAGGSQILVPVSRGGNSALPSQTPVIRVVVDEPGIDSVVGVAWGLLACWRSRCWPARSSWSTGSGGRSCSRSGSSPSTPRRWAGPVHDRAAAGVDGPPEVQELAGAVDRLVGRIELLLARERENVADLSHRLRTPGHRAAPARGGGRRPRPARPPRLGDLDALQATVDEIVARGPPLGA